MAIGRTPPGEERGNLLVEQVGQEAPRVEEFERGELLYEFSRRVKALGSGQGSRETLEELRRLGPGRG